MKGAFGLICTVVLVAGACADVEESSMAADQAQLTETSTISGSACATPTCTWLPTPSCPPEGAFCCSSVDVCSILTEAACHDYCQQQGLPLKSYACLKGTLGMCQCCNF